MQKQTNKQTNKKKTKQNKKKNSAYHMLSNEFHGICDHLHKSARTWFKEIKVLLSTNTMGSSSHNSIKWWYRGYYAFTQVNNDKNAQCAKQVNLVSLLESRLSELGRIPVNVLGHWNCFSHAVSCQLYNTPDYHLYNYTVVIRSLGLQHLLRHPELYIESNYKYSL